MINLNMEDTIYQAVSSVAKQLDENYEIVILDGGSSDGSLKEIEKLASDFPIVRYKSLERDRNRRMGLERNLSIEEARGEYVLLHIDCDDIYGPFIKDWVAAFHEIERHLGKDYLVSGQHINMIKRDFLLSLGGYRNVDFEDRELWMRCAEIDRYIAFNHVDFCTRLPRNRKKIWYKRYIETYQGSLADLDQGLSFLSALEARIVEIRKVRSFNSVLKFLYTFPAAIHTLFRSRPPSKRKFDPISFSTYRRESSKNLATICGVPPRSMEGIFSSQDACKIFHLSR